MNTADLISNWETYELDAFNDAEIQTSAQLYKEETLLEWQAL